MAPTAPSTAPAGLPKASSPSLKRRQRPYKPRKPRRKPIKSRETFIAPHQSDAARLWNYHVDARKGSELLDRAQLEQLAPRNALFLHAASPTARIAYATIAAEHIAATVGVLAQSTPVAFVTLIEERFTVGLTEDASKIVRRLQAWTHRRLRGCSFVGMVEAALYTNVGLVKAGMTRAVSWHVHLFVWGISQERLDALIAAANNRYKTLVPGVTPAHSRLLKPAEIEGQAYYTLKAPFSDHRIYERKREAFDPTTGEVTKEGTGEFQQRKQELRQCDLVRMVRVMEDQTLDRLAFAAGDGVAILEVINRRALAAYERWEDRQPWASRQ